MSINIPWVEVLKACFPSAKISENTDVIVVSPQYAADIAVIMSTTDRASLNNYLIWQLVHTYMPYLSSTYTEVMNMYLKFQTGAQKPLQRWEFCYDVTQKFFGHLMDSIYYETQVNKRVLLCCSKSSNSGWRGAWVLWLNSCLFRLGKGGGKRVCFFEYIHHRKFKSSRVSLNIFKWCD